MAPRLPPLAGHPWPFTNAPEVEFRSPRGGVTVVVLVSAYDEASEAMLERVALLCAHIRRAVPVSAVPLDIVAVHSPRHRFVRAPDVAAEWFGRIARRLADPTGAGEGVPLRPLHDPEHETWARLDPQGWPTALVVDHRGRVVGAGLGLGSLTGLGSALREAIAVAVASVAKGDRGPRSGDGPTTGDLPELRVGAARSSVRRLDAPLRRPSGVAVDGNRILIADAGNDRVLIGRLDSDRRRVIVEQARPVLGPRRVALRGDTCVVSRPSAGVVEVFRTTEPEPTVATEGSGFRALSDGLLRPIGVLFDRDGSVVVADAGSDRLVRYVPGETAGPLETHTIAGSGVTGLSDGPGGRAELCQPVAVTRVEAGLVFLDAGTGSVRLLDDRGRVATLTARPPVEPGLVDGPVHEASFQHPVDVAASPNGSLFVADFGNDRIRQISERRVRTLGASGLGSCEGLVALDDDRLLVVDGARHRLVVVDHARHEVWPLDIASVAQQRL